MDVVTHAAVGMALGYRLGSPLTGAFFAILPDIVLGWRRRESPNAAYRLTHSLWLPLMLVWWWKVAALSVLSHIFIDVFTHGKEWSPRLFFPCRLKIDGFEEWEFFNRTFWLGLLVSAILITLTLTV